jgi:N-acetylmuramoyl-L-alanine amidase
VTTDMTYYHAFQVIDPATPAAIIETGFLFLDRDLLTNHPDKVAEGIVSGVICFITNQSAQPTPNIGP